MALWPGSVGLSAGQFSTQTPQPVQSCDWYELTQGGHATRICWSASLRLPLLIDSAQGAPVWRVTEVDRRPIAAWQFATDDRGFVRNDANTDISGD